MTVEAVQYFREQVAIVGIEGIAAAFRCPGGGRDGLSAGGGWGHPVAPWKQARQDELPDIGKPPRRNGSPTAM